MIKFTENHKTKSILLFTLFITLLISAANLKTLTSLHLNPDDYGHLFFPVKLLSGYPATFNCWFPHSIDFLGIELPIQIEQAYTSSFSTILLTPFIYLFGISPFVFRLTILLIVLTGYISFFFVFKMLFSERLAYYLFLITVLSPAYFLDMLYATHIHEPIISAFFFSSALMFLLFCRRKNLKFLLGAAFLLGICFSIKLTIIWRIGGLIAGTLALYRKQLYSSAQYLFRKPVLLLALFLSFSGGASVFLVNTINNRGDAFKKIYAIFTYDSSKEDIHKYEGSDRNYLNIIRKRLEQYFSKIIFPDPWFYQTKNMLKLKHRQLNNAVFISLFIVIIIYINLYTFTYRKELISFFLYSLVILTGTLFSLDSLQAGHLMALFPLGFLVPAAAFDISINNLSAYHIKGKYLKKLLDYSALTLSLVFFLLNITYLLHFYKDSANNRVTHNWYYAMNKAAAYILKNDIENCSMFIYPSDPETDLYTYPFSNDLLQMDLILKTHGKKKITKIYYESGMSAEDLSQSLRTTYKDDNLISGPGINLLLPYFKTIIFHRDAKLNEASFGSELLKTLEKLNYSVNHEADFYDQNNLKLFALYNIKKIEE